ncbi:enoyl-CoA hydratase/isomerase family protein [Paracoccus sp. M683]|uniref:enoyl-CoA hydratase/isomerase family protein n=1 Tax=Paracoccus sp. M683 TaxID=2594268 RepID=UPI00117C9A71|nr:enoyl-CoA hydratase/isomerase family protein [Paracoccus sp. M683]TRW94598.1 enoyl-CoA hydratase/isomerase family protein [Paracoccus sp. M683]
MSIATDQREDGLLTITLNDPQRRNPIGHTARKALGAALSDAATDDGVRAVVLTGAGGHFSAGGDIRDQGARSLAAHRERFSVISDMVSRMARFPKPLVAAVEGWAAGGGLALALACPTVVASREARFIASFTKIALMPDMGLLSTLPARIGPARARRFILTNRVVDAPEAERLGMVDELADANDALRVASALAMDEAQGPAMPRQFVLDWFARDLSAALEYEQALQPMLLNSADAAEGRAAFAEKRPPQFRGR